MRITDEELQKKLEELYGKNWCIDYLDVKEPFAAEFLKRLETGV